MKIYNDNGYVDIDKIVSTGIPFIFVYGGRGTGKTYGAVKYALEHKRKFIFTRRQQSQIDNIAVKELSPFNPVLQDLGIEADLASLTKNNKMLIIDDQVIAITAALSTISGLRGFSAEDVSLWIYDEFIPEPHERPIKREGEAFLNAYETINRNRELKGQLPLQVLCLANANDEGNALFMELGLVKIVEKMKLKGQEVYMNRDRGILIVALDYSPISEQKKDTALYKMLGLGSQYTEMAISNKFISDSIAVIKSQKLVEYRPLVKVADCTIYKHKSEKKYYYSEHNSGSPEVYSTAEADIEKFRKKYYYLWNAYLNRDIIFENKLTSLLFERLW